MTPARETFSPHQLNQIPTSARPVRPAALRQFQSSPSIPLLSAGLAPEGSMRLPSFNSQFTEAPSELEEEDQAYKYEAPNSREEMPAAYPDGPICIYEPGVYLYLEPSAEQAFDYDVIFNVASEVLNPFQETTDVHVPSKSLKDAAEALRDQQSQGHLPNSNDLEVEKKVSKDHPEYIHVPWEHNTDIVPDLHELVKVVDDRVESGKRVLIHCQCGVSRSASLIVAYGLFKNPAMTVQQAYDAVKRRSKWIGPNMNLIMQLQEFRSGLIKSNLATNGGRRAQTLPGKTLHGRQSTTSNGHHDSSDTQVPQTAPLPPAGGKHGPSPIQTESLDIVSPGPASAPCDSYWPANRIPDNSSSRLSPASSTMSTTISYVDAAGKLMQPETVNSAPRSVRKNNQSNVSGNAAHVAPAPLNFVAPIKPRSVSPAPGPLQFPMSSIQPSDLDPTFGITSPRISNFATPLTNSLSLRSKPLDSPRSETFAMVPVQAPELTDTATLGLTSPRTSAFPTRQAPRASRLNPTRYTPPPPRKEAPASNKPRLSKSAMAAASPAKQRLEQNNALALLSPRAMEFTASPFSTAAPLPTPMYATFAEALMSPRPVELAADPMMDALAVGRRERASTVGHAPVRDPRSPPVKGGNVIVRDIFEVL